MKTIKSMMEIKNNPVHVYVRWSQSILLDIKRGHSLRYGSQTEYGLSACEIDPLWEDWRILRQIKEYEFTGAANCWLITGEVVGRGGDNEPLLINIRVLGKVSKKLLAINWRKLELQSLLAREEECLAIITDPIGIKITIDCINRYREELKSA